MLSVGIKVSSISLFSCVTDGSQEKMILGRDQMLNIESIPRNSIKKRLPTILNSLFFIIALARYFLLKNCMFINNK